VHVCSADVCAFAFGFGGLCGCVLCVVCCVLCVVCCVCVCVLCVNLGVVLPIHKSENQ